MIQDVKLKGNPYPKQIQFFQSRKKRIAYGGARGGGKSWAMRRKLVLMCLKNPGIQILLLRRTYAELEENHLIPLYNEIHNPGIAKYKDKNKSFTFPNGSRLKLGYCDNEKDVLQYQGQAYDVIAMEEATMFTEFQYNCLTESNRPSGTMTNQIEPRMYFTCNPGGVGHKWIKRLFIDKIYRNKEKADDYEFIAALVWDNKYIMENDPGYVDVLENLPEERKKAMLYGDWNVFAGQFFDEFRNNPEGYINRQYTHVIADFDIPDNWRRFRTFDWGYSKPFSVGWWAMDNDGCVYRYRELYGCTAEANTGVRWDIERIAAEVKQIEESFETKGTYIRGIADPAIFEKSRGQSMAELFEKNGVFFEPGDNKRIPGWLQMHNRMTFDENGYAMLYVFESCKGFIRTIPELIHDTTKVEDLDSTGEDHIADESRYFCMTVPISERKLKAAQNLPYNPLADVGVEKVKPGIGFLRS